MLAQPQPTPPPPAPPPAPPEPTPAPAPALPRGWLRALLHAIRDSGVQPKDPRVKGLWKLLQRRQLLARSPWARTRVKFIWQQGLNARPRPRTYARLVALLKNQAATIARQPWLKAARQPAMARAPMRRLRPVAVRRVATLRPVARPQPMRPAAAGRRGR